MRAILVGCEYAGKTTLADQIVAWTDRTKGPGRSFHDHFTIPNTELSPEAREQLLAATPQLKEMFQRFMIAHHLSHGFYDGPDQSFVGFHIEEAVYAPLYYGYGGENSGAPGRSPDGQRAHMAREVEKELNDIAPDSVLVLLKASAEEILRRMREDPHEGQVVRPEHVNHVLSRFEEEYDQSLLRNKFVLDTTNATPEETLAQFLDLYRPYFTKADLSGSWSAERLEQIDRAGSSYL